MASSPPVGTHCGTPMAPSTHRRTQRPCWHMVGGGGGAERISEPTSPPPIWGCAVAAAPSHSIAQLQGGLRCCMGAAPVHGGSGVAAWEGGGASCKHIGGGAHCRMGGCIPLWGLHCSVPAWPRCAAASVCGAAKHSAGLKPPHSQRAPPGTPPDGSGLDPDPQRRSPQPASRGGPSSRGHGCATGVSPCPPPPFPVPPPTHQMGPALTPPPPRRCHPRHRPVRTELRTPNR